MGDCWDRRCKLSTLRFKIKVLTFKPQPTAAAVFCSWWLRASLHFRDHRCTTVPNSDVINGPKLVYTGKGFFLSLNKMNNTERRREGSLRNTTELMAGLKGEKELTEVRTRRSSSYSSRTMRPFLWSKCRFGDPCTLMVTMLHPE